MPAFLDAVQRLVAAFEPEGATAFTLFGRRIEVDDTGAPPNGSVFSPETRQRLEDALYDEVHCREAMPRAAVPAAPEYHDYLGARRFVERLSAANGGVGGWQSGWTLRDRAGAEHAIVERYGVRFFAGPDDVLPADAAPGAQVHVRVPKEYRELIPGFYMAVGNALDDMDWGSAVRLYWHVTFAGAVPLTECLTRTFNEGGVPFRFKLLSDPRSYVRVDSAVLYLTGESYVHGRPLVERIHRAIRSSLAPALSPFVKPLAEGLGVAEDPGSEMSYGQHRCRLLASALDTPAYAAASTVPERVALVLARLRRDGLDPDAIHLRPGSTDVYEPLA